MHAEQRKSLIIDALNKTGFVEVSELAEKFNVTTVTIRRDLEKIETDGLCIRKQGGAVRVNPGVTMEMPYDIKRHKMVKEKDCIATQALQYIVGGNTLILDSGSTTYTLALKLKNHDSLTVVTNDLNISVELSASPKVHLICTGGVARSTIYSLEGSITESIIKNIKVDKLFLGADAIHADGVISNFNIEEVSIKRAMIEAAHQVILLADSSKFSRIGFYKVCDLSEVDVLITDDGLSPEAHEMIKSQNVNTEIVKVSCE